MRWMAALRWLAFVVFIVLCLAVPPAMLWGLSGLVVGALAGLTLLVAMRLHGTRRICALLRAKPLSRAQAPTEYALVEEYCRRLRLEVPRLLVIEAPGLNIGVFGFSGQDTRIVFTRGLLETLTRAQLAGVIARALCRVWTAEVTNETWLTRFFDLLQVLVLSDDRAPHRSETLALRRVIRQVLLYPLTLFPAFVLQGNRDEEALDARAVQITQDPQSMAEAFRRMEAMAERIPYRAPFSTRHLFLASPPTADPLARIFFSSSGFRKRVRAVEGRTRAVPQV
jgi:heat shock protein HtpX